MIFRHCTDKDQDNQPHRVPLRPLPHFGIVNKKTKWPLDDPRSHVVILGAGASRASFPSGDRNGKPLPLIYDLQTILGKPWDRLINRASPPKKGFEAQFSWIRSQGSWDDELAGIEEQIETYFEDLELPDEATIYDHLVLGLRLRDVIATFNWDPLLMLAHKRNREIGESPNARFLHGGVGFASCQQHDIFGAPGERCPDCHEPLTKSRLIFPDDKKDYTKDTFINRDWEFVKDTLRDSFHLTIFGYSGPQTDYNARRLLRDAWNSSPVREFSHVEIIDLKNKDALVECWKEFIPYDHTMIRQCFWKSTIAQWPRRTQEYKRLPSHYGLYPNPDGPLRTKSLAELQDWHMRLVEEEDKNQE